jgi:iron-sulfur cluster repair protein YtfE (RIC family)
MNAIELLKKDHRTVKSLFESFEKAKEKEEETSKAELFASIKEELDAHAQVEEEIFYPAFDQAAEKEDDKELVLEAGEEHKQVKTLLAELEGLDPDDETFDAKMKVLKDNIEHHVEEEEGEMFPHAQKQLGGDRLEQLGQRIAARKEEIQQHAGSPAARTSASQSASSPSSRARTTSPGRRSGRGSSAKGGKAGVAPASRSSRNTGSSASRASRSRSASSGSTGKRRSSSGRSSSTGRSTGARRSSGGRTTGRSTSGRGGRSRGRGRSART